MSAIAARVDMVLALTTYNTITIPAGQVYQLVTSAGPPAGPFYYNVLNLGPAQIYIAAGRDPVEGAADVETLPANWADNAIFVSEGTVGLSILAGAAASATITVRVAQSIGVW